MTNQQCTEHTPLFMDSINGPERLTPCLWCQRDHWLKIAREQDTEIEKLQRENQALRNLAENLKPGPISEAFAIEPTPKRAYFETHSPPHCPTCECVVEEAAPVDPAAWSALKSSAPRTAEQHRILNANLDQVEWGLSSSHFKGDDTKPCENCGEYFSSHEADLNCPAKRTSGE